jgi:hypothetical protein
VKHEFQNKHHLLYLLQVVMISYKTKLLVLFTSLIIEWTKALPIDMDEFHKKKSFFGSVFSVVVTAHATKNKCCGQYNLFSKEK